MNVKDVILELLSERALVIIPEFGALLSEEVPASFVIGGTQIKAPSKTIRFNSILKKNDGILQSEISLRHKISHEEALENILNQVEEWKVVLRSGGIIKFVGCGMFRLDDERHISFTPNEIGIASLKSFGLDEIQLKLIEKSFQSNTQDSLLYSQEEKSTIEVLEETAPLEDAKEIRRKRRRRTRSLIMSILLTGIIGTAQLAIFTDSPVKLQVASSLPIWDSYGISPVKENPVTIVNNKVIKWDFSDHLMVSKKNYEAAESVKSSHQVQIDNSESLALKNGSSVPTIAKQTEKKFAIILGCFKSQENIDRLSRKIESKGKTLYKINISGNLFQIGYYVGGDKLTAQNELNNAKAEQKDAWLKAL